MIFGPRSFIPKIFRKKEFNYFRTIDELTKDYPNAESVIEILKSKLPCPICLTTFGPIENQENDLLYNENACKRLFVRINMSLQSCYKSCTDGEKNKPLMITPCKHIFHSSCLLLWHETNLICPICREALPPIE
jgi:hypothetical protein